MAKKRRRKRFSPISLSNNGSDFLKDWEEENDFFNYTMFFGNQWKPEKLANDDQASSYAVSYLHSLYIQISVQNDMYKKHFMN